MEELLFIDCYMIQGYGYMNGCPWSQYYKTHHSIREQFIINPILESHYPKDLVTGTIYYDNPIPRGTLVVFGIAKNSYYNGEGI